MFAIYFIKKHINMLKNNDIIIINTYKGVFT